ncbi:MAG: hypothetical protein NTY19_35430 [Planctomycetota bacterium]|nr:hypothetical protein [Planctomycetota bacterium]
MRVSRLLLTVAVLSALAAWVAEVRCTEAAEASLVVSPHSGSGVATPVVADELSQLIARLDAPWFDARQQATRELAIIGPAAVPCLVEALGDASCEVRIRARQLLGQHNAFEEVASQLVAAVEKPYGRRVRELLVERALLQIDAGGQLPHADQLFKFWGTTIDDYRVRVRTQLSEAKTREELVTAVTPLMGLSAKTTRFSDTLVRLETLSLAYEGSYDPGAAIALTLARGLAEEHAGWIAFAEQHLQALEQLVAELKRRNTAPHGIKQELSERVNMSHGAGRFLVEVLDEKSPQSTIVSQRIGLTSRSLTDEFCRGLAAPEAATYDRGVGRVHIVDMLTETLRKWPAAPEDGVVRKLIASTTDTANAGDKPKALAYLDALEACRELAAHRLDIHAGLGKQLAERLYAAAAAAANNRVYSPARRLHDKLVALVDRGLSPEHDAFPSKLLEDHLRGAAEAASDEQLLAVERYLRGLDRLQTAGLGLEQPGVKRFVLTLKDRLLTRHDQVAAGVTRLEQLLATSASPSGQLDADAVDLALGQWTP